MAINLFCVKLDLGSRHSFFDLVFEELLVGVARRVAGRTSTRWRFAKVVCKEVIVLFFRDGLLNCVVACSHCLHVPFNMVQVLLLNQMTDSEEVVG